MFTTTRTTRTTRTIPRLHSLLHRHRHHSTLRRSYLYVPSSSSKLLEKTLSFTPSSSPDVIIYDLEDSVSPKKEDKEGARDRLRGFLQQPNIPDPERIAVRINDVNSPFFAEDVKQILSLPQIRSLILPKIDSAHDLHYVSRHLNQVYQSLPSSYDRAAPLRIIPSIESPQALINLTSIGSWKSDFGEMQGGKVSGLLFAAEDYCASTSIIRTRSRQELLYTRSQIAIAARAFGLEGIDMVCIHYKDLEYLKDECEDGRRLGFSGKQAIHPSQVETIQKTFVPTEKEIRRAALILASMKSAHDSAKGAIGLEGEMIDAPMIKQAEKIIQIAKEAGLEIPVPKAN
ncbi:hypothetical protein GYMLUDRAFT_44737 [Collybiopsis luxurians FD-317 M1]|uniref:HpcH/HpaI aldolase/citrate lyase domain-containing protein n=1 Tax=Collybiopsis luxurians FD-317 M1 TaxID=944289 RepID=A0A0D0BV43_9AGAR|nr:hypothetical protein GYMLUDRAFT_44737 [Collybiopsis luxurians FD-317 M1]